MPVFMIPIALVALGLAAVVIWLVTQVVHLRFLRETIKQDLADTIADAGRKWRAESTDMDLKITEFRRLVEAQKNEDSVHNSRLRSLEAAMDATNKTIVELRQRTGLQ